LVADLRGTLVTEMGLTLQLAEATLPSARGLGERWHAAQPQNRARSTGAANFRHKHREGSRENATSRGSAAWATMPRLPWTVAASRAWSWSVDGAERDRRARWHARSQGFESPQLHTRSAALSGPDRSRFPPLGQQIGSNPRTTLSALPARSALRRPDELGLERHPALHVIRGDPFLSSRYRSRID